MSDAKDPAAVVQASALCKRYGERLAVDHIDFSVPRSRCFGFLGPNGAGKTTTLRLLLGLSPMTSGSLRVLGLPIPQAARQIRARAGLVPQEDNLDPDFTVVENLRVYADYYGLRGAMIEQRIAYLLDFAALTDRADTKTDTLSGGMKRRLTVARALINRPELVILDEPTTGLDPQARHLIWSKLAELRRQGTSLILTTHYMEEAERLCDELLIMDHGTILDQGSPKALIDRHVESELIEVHGDGEAAFEQRLAQTHLPGRFERMGSSLYCYVDDAEPLLRLLHQTPHVSFVHRPTGLEDVFLKLTGRELRDP